MVLQAAGELPPLDAFKIELTGASIEARIYAEDPARNFQPTPGKLTLVTFPSPEIARTETWIESGATITPYYDPMIAKIIATGKDRTEALARLDAALEATHIDGTETNLAYLCEVARSKEFVSGTVTTAFLGEFLFKRKAIEILEGGPQSTIQNYPGRIGYRNVGVPPQAKLAQQKYTQAVRPDAPWCPSNIEFIRRINGLDSIDDVHRIVYEASYLVLGLGDVYLGAPVATPVDPRHRLVTTKYNPARTWTPENAVGIGGAYMCVYGMEGPGGYQLVGRTIQVWNAWKTTSAFVQGKPWSLRFFDQIRFYPVSADELMEARERFPHGQYELRVEETTFKLAEYQSFLASIAPEAAAFKRHQKESFNAERERWKAAGQMTIVEPPETPACEPDAVVPEGCEGVSSSVTASVFQIPVAVGDRVEEDQKLVVLDAMKMEIAITSHVAGVVEEVHCKLGSLVMSGQLLVSVRPS